MSINLYINQSNFSLFYDDGNYCYPYDKKQTLLQAVTFPLERAIGSHFIWDYEVIFLEDYFDPKTRIKRGRLFKKSSCAQPINLYQSSVSGIYQKSGSGNSIYCYQYEAFRISRTHYLKDTNSLSLGFGSVPNRWELILLDEIHSQEEVLTIRNLIGFKDFPYLDEAKIPQRHFQLLKREYDALIDDMYALPESVVDHCRDVATKLLISKMDLDIHDQRDLGESIKIFSSRFPKDYDVIKNCASIINRFHPRRKPNEYESKDLIQLTESNSEFTKRCIFIIIKELEWEMI